MFDTMKRRLVALSIIVAVPLATVGAVEAQNEPVQTTGPTTEEARWEKNGCKRVVTRKEFRIKARRILKSYTRITRRESRRIKRMIRCARTDNSAKRMNIYRKKLHRWRKAHKWQLIFKRLPPWTHGWARSITSCESTWNRYAHNGDHHSYFQFSSPTWAAAGGRGHPEDNRWHYQAIIAIKWMFRAGSSQWECVA